MQTVFDRFFPLLVVVLLTCLPAVSGCSDGCGSTPSPSSSGSEPGDGTTEASPVAGGLSVKLRWIGDAEDEVVPGLADVPECAAAGPAGRLVLGRDSGLADAIVRVADAPGTPDVPAEATLAAAGCRFQPRVLVVPPSTPLSLENSDSTLHTFHFWKLSEDGEQNHQNVAVPPGVAPTRLVLDDAGRYRVTSDRFEHMEAWILVAPGGTSGVTDQNGRLELPGIPPGDHAVEILHPALGSRIQQVTVPNDGPAALHLDLQRP